MIIDDILDEVMMMEDLATEYLIYLDGDQTEEMLYKAIEKICQYSFMVAADDVVSCFYQGIQNHYTVQEMLNEIFDFNGMMGYFDDEEIEEDTFNEALTYFNETKNRVNFLFKKYLTNG